MREKNVMEKEATLTGGPIGKTLFQLTLPMIAGIISIVIFNIVDAFFLGRYSVEALAAVSFTFPVIMVINSIALGMGIGAAAVISRAIGTGDSSEVKRLTTNALLLGLTIVLLFVGIGLATIKPLFLLLGVKPDLLPLIYEYMYIWYLGMIFIVVPMVGNNALRASGDTLTPGIIMMAAAGVNAILDPLFIFGIGPFPEWGVRGAAVATVIGRSVTFTLALYILSRKKKMLTVSLVSCARILQDWGRIIYIGLPAAWSRLIIPLAIGILTRIMAAYGTEHVAGLGVSLRIEFFCMAVVMALSVVLGVFAGQNFGAGKIDRLKHAVFLSGRFSLIWNGALWLIFLCIADIVAPVFNSNSHVTDTIKIYLTIVPVGYGLHGIVLLNVMVLNVLNKPLQAFGMTVTEMIVLYVPLTLIGSSAWGIKGIFAGVALAYLVSGVLAHVLLRHSITALRTN